jgi:hypothetical protein
MSTPLAGNFEVNAALPLDEKINKATLAARDAIPPIQRYRGMIVTVKENDTTYRLGAGLTNADWNVFGGGVGGGTWTPLGVTTAGAGGIAAGVDLGTSPVNTETTLRDIFFPYTPPSVSLGISPATTLREFGDNVTNPVLTPTTTRGRNPITTLTLSRSGVGLIHTYPSPNPAGGTESPYTDTSGSVTSNTTYTAIVGDGTSTGSGSASYTFQSKIYHGVSSSVINTGAGIMANFAASGVFSTGRAATYNFDASVGTPPNYLYIAYPAIYGPASPALPTSTFGGFAFSDFTSVTSTLTNASGYTQDYIILKTNNPYNSAGLIWVIS